MTQKELEFATYCIGTLSDATNTPEPTIHKMLDTSGVMSEYIIPCYNVLHTFGKQYIIDDIRRVLSLKGIVI